VAIPDRLRTIFAVADVEPPQLVRFREAELHWYEASGIGKKEFKIKRFMD
jgi:hypothetical protein